MKTGLIFAALFFLSACAQQRPVLYPNEHLKATGKEAGDVAIDECMRLAKEHGADEDKGERVAKDTAKGAVVGAAVGAAVGAVLGNPGRSAAAGAAGGGAGSLARGTVDSNKPDDVFKGFVERCLREKGFEPVGWR